MPKSLSYKDVPGQPFPVSSAKQDAPKIRKQLLEYHRSLIERLTKLDPTIGYGYRPDLVVTPNEVMEIPEMGWHINVYKEPLEALRNLITQIENHIQVVKSGGQV